MLDHFSELLHLIARWVHLIAGIMWIGNSMLFNWLDRNLEKATKPNSLGTMWMVHSGGFYEVEKKFLEPSQMPKTLHWFKWQNGITWLSGISLLILVFHMSAASSMVDPEIADISARTAILISVATIVGAYVAYDVIWRSPLGKRSTLAFLLSVAVVIGASAIYFRFLSGRAAYIHVGVLLGTLMTGNVWFVILPSQRELIAATKEGREQDPKIGYQAKERSIHNNYMTFPLLFIMLSGHFPSTFTHQKGWLILLILALGSAGIRHLMNVRFTQPMWLLPAISLFVITAGMTWIIIGDKDLFNDGPKRTTPVAFGEVADIVHNRCTRCHSENPSDPVYKSAPNGVMFDTPDQIMRRAADIKQRAVTMKNMPLANVTKITDEERAALGAWVDQGAKGPAEGEEPAPSASSAPKGARP
ncbi:MAG: urate hydroxylase PuuD [Polyangiaceae bacterium]